MKIQLIKHVTRYKKESDVMNAGMLAYYVATKGKHPFGTEDCRLQNLLDGNHVGLYEIKDAAFLDLLLWMLQLKPEDRPSANEALKHPYLQSDKEKFDMLCDVGNQPEIKPSKGQNSHVRKQLDCHSNWMELIDDEVLEDFKTFKTNGKKKTLTYKPTWASCLRFIRNVGQHWKDKPRPHLSPYVKEGNYKKYFLQHFPDLSLRVHKIIRSTDWKTRTDLEEHFTYTVDHVKIEEVSVKKSKDVMDNVYLDELQLREWKYNDKSTKHKELFLKLIEYGKDPNVEVKHVDDVRVIFSEEFLLGKGSDGTRVYLGLGKDGYGKAVKRILRDTYLAEHEEKIFNEISAKKSDYVLNYYCSRQDTGTEYVHLILDLCEESLERFVLSESNSLDYLQKSLPNIFKQILNGLVDLHSDPRPILHRDLKPSNVLRDTQGKFLIADFGISRIMKNGSQTNVSDANRGTPHWIAPESYIVDENLIDKARYKTKSDVMNAGMVAYFVATKGKHPFGTKECILQNLLKGKPVGLKEISNVELNDLLSWMLQHKPELRPSAKEALKHPYLLSDEEKFELLCKVRNQPEIKIPIHLDHPLSYDVHEQLNGLKNWKDHIDLEVFSNFNVGHYDATWLGCLNFIQNVYQQWKDEHRTKLSPYIKKGNYKEYFVRVLPELPLLVHRIMRLNEWVLRPDMEKRVPNAEDNLDEHIKIFKSKFLDKRSNIKADVCDVLESFTWLRGEYGTAGPNEKMPFPHLYVMVDDSQEKSNEIIKQEIDGKFGWEASKYIDLPRKAPKKANFRLLSDFRAARKDQNDVGSRGTLTIICRKEERYFALTCAHVGVDSDFADCQGVFNREDWLKIRDAVNSNFMKYNMVYFYKPSHKDSEVQLGHDRNDAVCGSMKKQTSCVFLLVKQFSTGALENT
ncbi:uncharacterized protein LOC124437960 isoform X2 [Xenia sp. Carnegie-2017]|uniref:uncharacterized protein LOC124437960 isoform X2 n=1 Tax=Xenia sp. Carnegie-2017 TaxID=2897299 RepID=UPI001F033B75|nr:uncharacterized protein LOC124437960 isoform X2 [Xenia sp. Carnegie-2017]